MRERALAACLGATSVMLVLKKVAGVSLLLGGLWLTLRSLAKGDAARAEAPRTGPRYLTVVAVVRDEARWLPEWLAFHHHVAGVEHFILYDHNSTDGTRRAR